MTEQSPRARALWLALYGVICAAEFVLGRAKDWVESKIWPSDGDEEDDEE